MKKAILSFCFVSAILFALQCSLSCTHNDGPDDNGNSLPDKLKPQPGLYTFVASEMIGQWKEGDRIVVRGSYAPKIQVIEFKAGDISADGKTATAELGEVTQYCAAPDNLYAAWPAEVVKEEEESVISSTITFNQWERPLAAAYLSLADKKFVFGDAVSKLTFTVNGSYTKYAIGGADRTGIRFSVYSTDYTSDNPYFLKPKSDGYPFRYGDLEDGKTTIWFPGGATFTGGYTIWVGDGENWPMAYTVTEDTRIKAGKVLELGNITSKLTAYTGPAPRMPEMGKMTKYAVDLNELSGLCLSADGSFLWGLGDGGELARLDFEGKVQNRVGISGDTEGVTIDKRTGDLLIAMEPSSVGRVASPDFNKNTTIFRIQEAGSFDNAGMEGITYYKDGIVYCGTQTGSYLYICDMNNEFTGDRKYLSGIVRKDLRDMHPSITEIADLCYDPLTDWLWVIDSEKHKITVLTGDAEKILGSYQLKTKSNEESLCVDHANHCVWVGDDYGSTSYLFKYEFTGLDDAIIE